MFIPQLKPGDLYKFEIKGQNDFLGQKSDPYAFYSELRPRTASVVWDYRQYEWQDKAWMEQRQKANWMEKRVRVYEVDVASW